MRAAHGGNRMGPAPAVGMKQGNRVHQHIFITGVMVHSEVHRMQVHVPMREHHALRAGAGPAGIKNLGHGVFIKLRQFSAVGHGGSQHLLIGLVREPRRLRRSIKLVK